MIVFAMLAVLGSDASNTRSVSAGMEVPNAIVKQHNAYVLCQDDHCDIRRVSDQQSFLAEAEKAIVACKDKKASLVQEAEKILISAPDYVNQAERKRVLCEAFDSYDEMRRAMALGAQTYKVTCR
jgi:hypothetical protein